MTVSESKRLRVGLCGLGEIGQVHLDAIRESPDAELAAVCELDADLAARTVGDSVPVFDSVGAMIGAGIDVVDICLPHHLHVPVAVEALEGGCNVILEKPLAMDLAGCNEITAAAKAAGRRVGVSHNQLWFAPHRRLLDLVGEGSLGELRAIYARLWMGGKYGGWREDASQVGGGLLMDAGVHRIYMVLSLGGPVRAVTALMDRPRAEDSFTLLLEFESGATGVVQAGYHGPAGVFDDRLDIQGSDGMAEVLGCEAFFEGDLRGGPQLRTRLDGTWADDPAVGAWDVSVRDSVNDILGSLARGDEPETGLGAGRATVELIEAAYRSAEANRRIELGEPGS